MPSWFGRLLRIPLPTTPDNIASPTSGTSADTSASNLKTEPLTPTGRPQRPRFGFSTIASLLTRAHRRQPQVVSSPQSPTQGGPTLHIGATGRPILTPRSRSRTRDGLTESSKRPRNGAASTERLTLPPTSTDPKVRHLVALSGNFPITQPGIRESILEDTIQRAVIYNEVFEVFGGVNASRLLRATRTTILEIIRADLGANNLIDEQ